MEARQVFGPCPTALSANRAFVCAPGVVLMPSFVNLGAYVDERHDGRHLGNRWVLRANRQECAPVRRRRNWRRVLEPMQAGPTIIEDNCFIGARSEVVEGCIVREGSVLGMGVFIGKSTKIVDRETGDVTYGEVPPYSVVVAGSMPSKNNISLYCAVIVKRVDEKTRSKTGINELLRD